MVSNDILSNLLHLGVLIVGGIVLLRKVAEFERYHRLRVFVLTVIFSSPLVVLFILYVYFLLNPPTFICGNSE
jgi:hypothetical protein